MSSDAQFQIGDVVHLASGGPDLTVSEIDGDEVTLVYFKDGVVQYAVLRRAMLVKRHAAVAGPIAASWGK